MESRGDARRPNIFKKLFNKVFGRDSASGLLPGSSRNIKRHYEILIVLGEGGFGKAYLCRDHKTGAKYACKTMDKREIRVELVQREVNALKSLASHRNIVGFKDVFEDRDNFYLIMEYCDGGDLVDYADDKHFDESEAKRVIKSLVLAVQWCHVHGIVHGDIKADNIMFMKDKTLKLIDFGISGIFKPGQRLSLVKGTYPFMAPEVYLGDYGPQADIWSIGVILYTILGCRYPFPAPVNNFEKERDIVLHDEIKFNRRQWSKVSQEGQNIVKGMLERDANKRLTAHQILNHPWLRTERPRAESYSYRTTHGR